MVIVRSDSTKFLSAKQFNASYIAIIIASSGMDINSADETRTFQGKAIFNPVPFITRLLVSSGRFYLALPIS